MANPFLMMDEEPDMGPAVGSDTASNPFLMQDGQADVEYNDNPFVAQANNPFAGFGDEPETELISSSNPPVSTNDPAMSFFGTTIEDDDEPAKFDGKHPQLAQLDDLNAAYSSEEELTKKKGPPPRPLPPSQTTQDLIFAVADQLDQASSHLLGRLPATRTPSPVSMRDLHSPSPTPDAGLVDLLDVSDGSRPPTTQDNYFDGDLMGGSSDNPFAPTSIVNIQPTTPLPPPVKAQPPRPPPPRPAPPRPSPPAMPTAPSPTPVPPLPISQPPPMPQQDQEPDLFDMFGDSLPPKPPQPKTKEDILSLFSVPKPEPQPAQQDLLCGDFLDDIPADEVALPPPLSQPMLPSSALVSSVPPTVPSEPEPIVELEKQIPTPDTRQQTPPEMPQQPTTTVTEPQGSPAAEVEQPPPAADDSQSVMDSIAPEVTSKRAPTPDIEITTVESLPRSDDEQEPEPIPDKDIQPETELELADSEKAGSDQSVAIESNVTTKAQPGSPMDVNINDPVSEPEQMDTGLDFAPSIPSGSASANPFASPETEDVFPTMPQPTNVFTADTTTSVVQNPNIASIFGVEETPIVPQTVTNIFAEPLVSTTAQPDVASIFGLTDDLGLGTQQPPTTLTGADEFDAFSAKFDSAKKEDITLLEGFGGTTPTSNDAWGDAGDAFGNQIATTADGFGGDDGFDSFLAMGPPEPALPRKDSVDSLNDDNKEFNVVIRPKEGDTSQGVAPILAPPPARSQNDSIYSGDSSPRFNPFDKGDEVSSADGIPAVPESAKMERTDSQETPPTPLFDEDVSQPLEDFPRTTFKGTGWEMQLRQPNKKKITGQRFWKKIYIKLVLQGENPVLQLFNQATDKEPFQELPLQPCYSVSDIGAQQYDQFGKIFTIKLQYIFYKERPGVRPGQVTKAERLTNKLSQFAAYAIQGDYQGVKEFGSDLKKLGLPVEHAPQVSQLFKIGSMSFEDLKQFSVCIEEALFKLTAHRDRALNYKSEEVQITAVDELYVEQDAEGHVHKQIARVRLFFLGFLSGMPYIELGVNDLWRQGKEVVGRHDIIPVVTEEWIRLEGVEFHNSVQQDEYERSRTIKFQPPDACYIELMRFRVRPPKNRELPLQLKATWCVTGNRVELRADVLVPGFASRKLGQIPCEDVSIRFPIPECWIYLFRVEKHFRYGSVKSAHRRTGKIKGIERILGAVETLQESLIEVTSGQAKYEHHHRSIVWRCPRLPKEGQGAYTTHQMVCRMALTSFDQIPEQLAPYAYVEFTMPATQVSHTTVRSVSVQDSDSDEPPEKYVRYLARHEYRVGIEHTTGESPNAYLTATRTTIKEETPVQPLASPMAPSDSDSDSN